MTPYNKPEKVFALQSMLTNKVTRIHIVTGHKLDGVGPVGNRPSTDKLHQFVQKNKTKMTCDM